MIIYSLVKYSPLHYITPSAVHKWIKADKSNNGIMTWNSLSETDQQELTGLRAENKRLKTERDILKKGDSLTLPENLSKIRIYSGTEGLFYRSQICAML